jgi:isopentenyl-diphosphate delta-isomerase
MELNKEELVILVNQDDSPVGVMEKMEVHRRGLLHRAVSVFIFNSRGEWLLQRRAKTKYHSNSLWTNTCCSHPYPDETNSNAATRRLMQEMGMNAQLVEIFDFVYHEMLDNELIEHELDHVFVGVTDHQPVINTDEVMEFKYVTYDDLLCQIANSPEQFTCWFKKIVNEVFVHFTKSNIEYETDNN